MSSNAYVPPLRIELGASRRLRVWRLLTHGACLLTVPLLQSVWLAAAVALIVGASLLCRRERAAVLLWRSDGVWELIESDGAAATAVLDDTAFVQPWLVILPLRRTDGRATLRIPILPDMLPEDVFRRLRVRLRGRPAEADG